MALGKWLISESCLSVLGVNMLILWFVSCYRSNVHGQPRKEMSQARRKAQTYVVAEAKRRDRHRKARTKLLDMTARVTRVDDVVTLRKIAKRIESLKFKHIRSVHLAEALDRPTHFCANSEHVCSVLTFHGVSSVRGVNDASCDPQSNTASLVSRPTSGKQRNKFS